MLNTLFCCLCNVSLCNYQLTDLISVWIYLFVFFSFFMSRFYPSSQVKGYWSTSLYLYIERSGSETLDLGGWILSWVLAGQGPCFILHFSATWVFLIIQVVLENYGTISESQFSIHIHCISNNQSFLPKLLITENTFLYHLYISQFSTLRKL